MFNIPPQQLQRFHNRSSKIKVIYLYLIDNNALNLLWMIIVINHPSTGLIPEGIVKTVG